MKKQIFIIIIYLITVFTYLYASITLEEITGFPFSTHGNFFGSGAVADIDGDGIKEFIIADQAGYLYVIENSGNIKSGFPVYLGSPSTSSPAIVDITYDGYAEIIIGTDAGKLYVIRYDGSIIDNFPFSANHEIRPAPIVADINGNNEYEIIFSSRDGNLYVINAKGEHVEGFPQRVVPNTPDIAEWAWGVRASPAIMDLNRKGKFEIIIGANEGIVTGFEHNGARIFTMNTSSRSGQRIDAGIIIADMDNDGWDEIIIAPWWNYLYVFNLTDNGSIIYKPGFPYYLNMHTRAEILIYDYSNDGIMDFNIATLRDDPFTEHFFLQLTLTGDTASIKSNAHKTASSPVAADITNDGNIEFVMGTHDNKGFQILNSNTLDTLYTVPVNNSRHIESTAVINDFTNNGKVDILVGTQQNQIWGFTTNQPINYDKIIKSKFRYDLNNSGNKNNLSTPLIYEPKGIIVRDTNITFKWINMEGFPAVSSYKLSADTHNNWSDSDFINLKTYNDLADGKYLFQVKQFFNEKYTMSPAYRNIIVDNTPPVAELFSLKNYIGGNINIHGIAKDNNFGGYTIDLINDSGVIISSFSDKNEIDSGLLFSFDSKNIENGNYTVLLKVYELDMHPDYYSFDTISIIINNVSAEIYIYEHICLTSSDNKLSIEIPAFNFSTRSNITVFNEVSELNIDDIEILSDIYTIEFDDNYLRNNFVISFYYENTSNRDNLNIFFRSLNPGTIINIGGKWNPKTKTITSSYNKSGTYFLGISENEAFPNETNLNINKRVITKNDLTGIIINGMSNTSNYKIYDLTGNKIYSDNSNIWNGNDKNGRRVSAGMYIMYINNLYESKRFIIYVK